MKNPVEVLFDTSDIQPSKPRHPGVALRFFHPTLTSSRLAKILNDRFVCLHYYKVKEVENSFEIGLVTLNSWPFLEEIIKNVTGHKPEFYLVRPIDNDDPLLMKSIHSS